MKAKVRSTGEVIEGRMWDTGFFKAWPPDERLWCENEIDIIEQ